MVGTGLIARIGSDAALNTNPADADKKMIVHLTDAGLQMQHAREFAAELAERGAAQLQSLRTRLEQADAKVTIETLQAFKTEAGQLGSPEIKEKRGPEVQQKKYDWYMEGTVREFIGETPRGKTPDLGQLHKLVKQNRSTPLTEAETKLLTNTTSRIAQATTDEEAQKARGELADALLKYAKVPDVQGLIVLFEKELPGDPIFAPPTRAVLRNQAGAGAQPAPASPPAAAQPAPGPQPQPAPVPAQAAEEFPPDEQPLL